MNLIIIKPAERLTDTDAVDLSPNDERTKHILSHLNKTTGDTVSVGLVDSHGGCKGKAVVLVRQNGGIRLVLKANTIIQSPVLPEITLLLAVPFPARLKYLWPVIASFSAVTRVVIIRGKLSNPEFCGTSALKPSVYESMIEKGMSQGGRTRPIKVDVLEDESISRNLLDRLGLVCDDNTDRVARIFLDCGDVNSTPLPARDIVLEQCGTGNNNTHSAIVAVGPERGWTADEAKAFVNDCGFSAATLGCSILRVDTAVVAGLGIVSAALDECNTNNDREYKRQRQHSP
ncbi:hypothetical protein ACHAXR_004410 [Thalassiosira sp. AJA248-18]